MPSNSLTSNSEATNNCERHEAEDRNQCLVHMCHHLKSTRFQPVRYSAQQCSKLLFHSEKKEHSLSCYIVYHLLLAEQYGFCIKSNAQLASSTLVEQSSAANNIARIVILRLLYIFLFLSLYLYLCVDVVLNVYVPNIDVRLHCI